MERGGEGKKKRGFLGLCCTERVEEQERERRGEEREEERERWGEFRVMFRQQGTHLN